MSAGSKYLADALCNRNRIMTGLRFLFRVTTRRLDQVAEIYHIREPQKLRLVMSVYEVKRLLAVAKISRRFAGAS